MDRANQIVVGLVGEGEDSSGGDGELAAGREVVSLGEVEGNLDRLAGVNLLEVLILQVGSAETKAETLKLQVVSCGCVLVTLILYNIYSFVATCHRQ